MTAPSGSPVLGLVTGPAVLARPPPLVRPPGTPVVSATDLPLTQDPTTSRPSVPPPAIAVRPTLYHRSIPVAPSHVVAKRKSTVEDMRATKRQRTNGGKGVQPSVPPLEAEEDTGSLTEAIREFKREFNSSFVNPLPVPFLVVQDGVRGDIGLALEALDKYVKDQLKDMQSKTIKLAEIIDAKIATMAALTPESELKARRKLAKLDRTADDNQAYTFIKVRTFYFT